MSYTPAFGDQIEPGLYFQTDFLFLISLFEVEDSAAAMARFVQREEEFDLVMAPYVDDVGRHETALMCARGTDEMFVSRAGREVFERDYVAVGVRQQTGFRLRH